MTESMIAHYFNKHSQYPSMCVGEFSKYKNYDGSMTIYKNGIFMGAFEDTTIMCDFVYKIAKEIEELKKENQNLKQQILARKNYDEFKNKIF